MKRDIVLHILPNLPGNLKTYRSRSPRSADESSDNDVMEHKLQIASHSELYVYKPRSDLSSNDSDAYGSTSDGTTKPRRAVRKKKKKKAKPNPPVQIILYNKEILSTLNAYGYHIKDIINAMKFIVNPNDINEIMDRLDHCQKASVSRHIHASNARARSHKNTDPRDEMAQKRMFIEHEIISSESTYCECLDKLLNGLIYPMFDAGCVQQRHYLQIVSSIPQILEFHEGFLRQLSDIHAGHHKTMANIFDECIVCNKQRFIEIYIEFIRDCKPICELFTGEKNKKLDRFLRRKGVTAHQLPSFFILPVQRLPRYILLLMDLRKNTMEDSMEYKDIDDAVEQVKDITEEINERLALCWSKKRDMKQMAVMKEMKEKVEAKRVKGQKAKDANDNNESKKEDDIDINDRNSNETSTSRYVERFGFHFTFFSFIFIILLYARFSYLFYSEYL